MIFRISLLLCIVQAILNPSKPGIKWIHQYKPFYSEKNWPSLDKERRCTRKKWNGKFILQFDQSRSPWQGFQHGYWFWHKSTAWSSDYDTWWYRQGNPLSSVKYVPARINAARTALCELVQNLWFLLVRGGAIFF